MASTKLGRLRQWAGEKISSKEKSTVNEEFKELEKDIELRKEGIQRLILASEKYHHALSKKKSSAPLDDAEKMLPIDILGVVMLLHGEEFGEDSIFGTALVKLGRAHSKVATLQEAYALTFKDTFLLSMERFKDEIKEYELLKKKLESRRAALDSATTKFEKLQQSKKEKDKREAEDEMERTKQRYEETEEDLRAHMHAIQENEHNQLRDLTSFLDLEMNFVQSYLEVLKDVKSEWQDRSESRRSNYSSKDGHLQSFKSSKPTAPTKGRNTAGSSPSFDSSDDDDEPTTPGPYAVKHSRSGSTGSKTPSRPTSRLSRKRTNSSTATPRHASEDNLKEKEKEKDKEKARDGDRSRKMSVAGWASSAVESVTGGSKSKKSKDKDSFATLDDDLADSKTSSVDQHSEGGGSLPKSSSFRGLSRRSSKNKSKENLPANSPATAGGSGGGDGTPRILKPPSLQGKKVVRALYTFSGSSDELSFKVGDEIVVVQEVLDDWWMGEVGGQRGLFPTSYTEVVGPVGSVSGRPKLGAQQRRNSTNTKSGGFISALFDKAGGGASGQNGRGQELEGEGDNDHRDHELDHDHYLASDADDDHIVASVPLAVKSPNFYGGFNDSASFTDSTAEASDEEFGRRSSTQQQQLSVPPHTFQGSGSNSSSDHGDDMGWNITIQDTTVPAPTLAPPPQSRRNTLKSSDPAQQPLINRSISDNPITSMGPILGATTPTKKIPPPPPPRRAVSHNPSSSPPIPERKAPSSISSSNHASSGSLSGSINYSIFAGNTNGGGGLKASSVSGRGYDRSPFESSLELDGGVAPERCEHFRQNPFKPQGMCSNCLEFHD